MCDDVALYGTQVLLNIEKQGLPICSLLNLLDCMEMSIRRKYLRHSASDFNMPMGKVDTSSNKHQCMLESSVNTDWKIGQINISVLPVTTAEMKSTSKKVANEKLPIIVSITGTHIYSSYYITYRSRESNLKRSCHKSFHPPSMMLSSSTFNTGTLMYSKSSSPLEVPRPQLVLDSTIDIVDRNDRPLVNSTSEHRAEQLLCDHATLLLSIADIAQSEITQCPSALLEEESKEYSVKAPRHHRRITPSSLPSFPKQLEGNTYLMGSKPNLSLMPRNDSLRHSILLGTRSQQQQRHRSVSFDSPTSVMKNIIHPWESTFPSAASPLILPRSPKNCRTPRLEDEPEKMATPKRSNKSHSPYTQSSHKKPRLDVTSSAHHGRAKKQQSPQVSSLLLSPRIISSSPSLTNTTTMMITGTTTKQLALQGTPPDGITIRKVYRRKFSWKNYPQVR